MAERAGLDEKTARNIMAGKATRVDLETVARLCVALGVWAGPLWAESEVEPCPRVWEKTAGVAGPARPGELDGVLGGAWDEATDPALERANRHW